MPPKFTFVPGTGNPDFSVEVPVRAFEPERPYPQNPNIIVYRTWFAQLRAYYSKPVPNTPHPDLPQVYFADDIDFQDRMSGMIEWTRVYVTLGTQWNDFASEAYSFPGYQGTTSVLGRTPFTKVVTTKIVNDYYAVGTLPTFLNNVAAYDDFSNAAWTKSNCNAAANSTAIPACAGGGVTATKLTETVANGFHDITQASSLSAGNTTGSIFARAGERNQLYFALLDNTNGSYARVGVDLSTGQEITSSFGGTTQVGNYSVAAIGDGWWRINLTGNCPTANAVISAFIGNANALSYAGDGTSGLSLWRGQLVAGNSVPYSTVPPTTASDGTTNYPITTADGIPQKLGTQFLYQVPWGFGGSNAVAGQFVAEFLSDGGFGLVATSPSLTNYKANATTDLGNTNSYSIESADSVQSLWFGSIWERRRQFVKSR